MITVPEWSLGEASLHDCRAMGAWNKHAPSSLVKKLDPIISRSTFTLQSPSIGVLSRLRSGHARPTHGVTIGYTCSHENGLCHNQSIPSDCEHEENGTANVYVSIRPRMMRMVH